MLLAVDIDGTADADPTVFQWLLQAVRGAGGQVAILTGLASPGPVTPADVQAKQDYLAQLGVTAYDQLVVFPNDGTVGIAQLKADWCAQHDAAVLIDNSKSNCRAAADTCLVLTPWATRVK